MSHFIIASITLAKDANVRHLHRSWFCCCRWSDNGSNRAVLAFVQQQQPLPRVARAITTGKNRGSSKGILKLQSVLTGTKLCRQMALNQSTVQCSAYLLWRNEVLSRHTFSTLLVVVDLWAILKVESLLPTKPAKKATKKKYSFSIEKIINIRE